LGVSNEVAVMNVIEEIKSRLQKYPHVKYEAGANHIRVLPTSGNGFEVELTAAKNDYQVHFNGWHESFASAEEALNCFAFGLSTDCRLKEYRRGRVTYKWTVEYKEADKWIEDSTTGLLIYPFWGRQEIKYLQNEIVPGA
jgi:hypothetical protein